MATNEELQVIKERTEKATDGQWDVPALVKEIERLQFQYEDVEKLTNYVVEARDELYESKEYEQYFECYDMICSPENVVQGMTDEIKRLRKALQADITKKDLIFAEEENERLRVALRFYAAQGTYEPVYFECLKGTEKKIVPIERDNGETARHALQDHK